MRETLECEWYSHEKREPDNVTHLGIPHAESDPLTTNRPAQKSDVEAGIPLAAMLLVG